MGTYINPNNDLFKQILKNKIYVDKSLLIEKQMKSLVVMNQNYVFHALDVLGNRRMPVCWLPIIQRVQIPHRYLIP